MPKTRSQKEKEVQNLTDKLAKAKSVVFADYRGLSMKQLSELRSKLRDLNAQFIVTKNSLLDFALKNSHLSNVKSQLPPGPTAALFAYDDEISPMKILLNSLKNAGIGKIKMGFLGAEALDEGIILKLATLPSKDELRGKTVGVLAAPLQGMVSVLQANLSKLVYALSEIHQAKGGV